MERQGHQILVVARDKEVSQELLSDYGIRYVSRGSGASGLLGKFFYLIKANYIIMKEALNFKPDIFISFASPYAAQVSWLLRKDHISFTDTEHAALGSLAFMPFTSVIVTPKSFRKKLGKKHFSFNGFMEQTYLDNKYFCTENVTKLLGLKNNEKYILLRFVSWDASHDIGHTGLHDSAKLELVRTLSKTFRIFISSEAPLSKDFQAYKISIPASKMHHVLASASLFLGEGATMASECAMLGTPAIYINSLNAGTLIDQELGGCIFGFRNSTGVLEKANELLSGDALTDTFKKRSKILLKNTIDVTAFMVWLVENYPDSIETMTKNPEYLNKLPRSSNAS